MNHKLNAFYSKFQYLSLSKTSCGNRYNNLSSLPVRKWQVNPLFVSYHDLHDLYADSWSLWSNPFRSLLSTSLLVSFANSSIFGATTSLSRITWKLAEFRGQSLSNNVPDLHEMFHLSPNMTRVSSKFSNFNSCTDYLVSWDEKFPSLQRPFFRFSHIFQPISRANSFPNVSPKTRSFSSPN